MDDVSEATPHTSVRNLISAFERQTNYTEPVEDYYYSRPRAKSIGNALSYKLFRPPYLEVDSILDIEKELVKIEAHLNYYQIYNKETHVAFQEQLFEILKSIVSIDPESIDSSQEKKGVLIKETQRLAKILNAKLPLEGSRSYRKVVYSSGISRRYESAISSTTVNTEDHKSITSSRASLDGVDNSLESLHFRDTVDSSKTESNYSHNLIDHKPDSTTCISIDSDEEKPKLSTVSKLKRFFSFRTETKPPVKVIPAAYSGISRSASLNIKSNKYASHKIHKNEKLNRTEESISESKEEIANVSSQNENISESKEVANVSSQNDSAEEWNESHEVTEAIEESAKESNNIEVEDVKTTVSVSKLKGLFEKDRQDSQEGLVLLTNKQSKFNVGSLDIPYTEMSLGAHRLKRAISGNYINFGGVLNKVEISKKLEISRCKSMSNLIDERSLGFKEVEIDDDVNNAINSSLVSNKSVDVSKTELENVNFENGKEHDQEQNQETLLEGQVKQLKENFEKLNIHADNNDSITYNVYSPEICQTPIPNYHENSGRSADTFSRDVVATKHIIEEIPPIVLYEFTGPIESTEVNKEPGLKVPTKLRSATFETEKIEEKVLENNSEQLEGDFQSNEELSSIIKENPVTCASTRSVESTEVNEESRLKVTVKLRRAAFETEKIEEKVLENNSEQLEGHFQSNEELSSTIKENPVNSASTRSVEITEVSEESRLKVPVKLRRAAFETEKIEEKVLENNNEQSEGDFQSNEELSSTIKEDIVARGQQLLRSSGNNTSSMAILKTSSILSGLSSSEHQEGMSWTVSYKSTTSSSVGETTLQKHSEVKEGFALNSSHNSSSK